MTVVTSARRAPHGYLMPTVRNAKAKWQADTLLIPTDDPGVWKRSFHSAPTTVPYVWVHETSPDAPFEDYIVIRETLFGLFASLYCLALVLTLLVWSWGLFLAVIAIEMILKRLQYHATLRLTKSAWANEDVGTSQKK